MMRRIRREGDGQGADSSGVAAAGPQGKRPHPQRDQLVGRVRFATVQPEFGGARFRND